MTATTRTTHLFTVRMWREEANEGQGQPEWRGKVQALPEGEAYYFRDWPSLVAHMQEMLDVRSVAIPSSEPLEGDAP